MAKKKKTALKPVARGFATTSQPKKVEPAPEPEEEEPPKASLDEASLPAGELAALEGKQEGDDWEEGEKVEEARLQGYVERLQEKGDKEVNRILKSIEFDRRMNKGSIAIDVDPKLINEVLAFKRAQPAPLAPSFAPSLNDQSAKEKSLLRLYITSQVLTKLGYPPSRVQECLEYHSEAGLGAVSWEGAIEWVSA